MGVKIDNNGDSVHCMHFWQLFDHVVFSVIVNITVTKKVKSTVGYHSCCSGQVAASPARGASGVITRWWCPSVCLYVCLRQRVLIVSILACYCIWCDLLLPSCGRSIYDTIMTSVFGVIVHRHCRPRFDHCLQCTLSNKSALQTDKSAL